MQKIIQASVKPRLFRGRGGCQVDSRLRTQNIVLDIANIFEKSVSKKK